MKIKKNMKKVLSFFLGTSMLLSTTTALAAFEFGGYDTTTSDFGKIYNEKIGGVYTSKTIIDPLPQSAIKWVHDGYEVAYPHAGYERLYLEGNPQKITRYDALFPQWETRFKDYLWEICGDHRIYQRQQTYVPKLGWKWDFGNEAFAIPDSAVFVPTTRCAITVDSFLPYSVGPFTMSGKYISDATRRLYSYLGIDDYEIFPLKVNEKGEPTREIVDDAFFSDENLSVLAPSGKYAVSDAEIAEKAGLIVSKYVTGPSFANDNPTKNVAKAFTDIIDCGYDPLSWEWDVDTAKHAVAEISWTSPVYEMEEPYDYFQYLIINGLVFDGRENTPRIYRYTGGKATPDVQWKYQWPEKDYPYNMVEFKYVSGKLALDADGSPIYRFPTGEFANQYIKTTPTEIQFWLRDANGKSFMTESFSRTDTNFGYGVDSFVPAAGYVINPDGDKTK